MTQYIMYLMLFQYQTHQSNLIYMTHSSNLVLNLQKTLMSALFNRQARGILRALSESSPVLSLLSTKSLKFSAAAATSQQWSTCTKNQVRFYSPRQIRRNGPQGYDNRQYNDDQYSYEEPKVTYSYPNSSPSFSSAGYLQYSDPLVDIISQPCLVMERQVEFMNLFLVSIWCLVSSVQVANLLLFY